MGGRGGRYTPVNEYETIRRTRGEGAARAYRQPKTEQELRRELNQMRRDDGVVVSSYVTDPSTDRTASYEMLGGQMSVCFEKRIPGDTRIKRAFPDGIDTVAKAKEACIEYMMTGKVNGQKLKWR